MSVAKPDPWQVNNNNSIIKQEQQENGNREVIEKFEDNFNPNNKAEKIGESDVKAESQQQKARQQQRLEPLPDSANYLQLLERKLEKLQKGGKLLDSLQEKREDCMRTLLAADGVPATRLEQLFDFDSPIESGRLHRHLIPVQAVTVGETVQIVNYDALEDQTQDEEQKEQQQPDVQEKEII